MSSVGPGWAAEYGDEFFRALREGALRSARVIVPLVLDYVRPASVIDLGCGTGTWLSVFREHGVTDTVGVDGDYVRKETLEIPDDQFLAFDLTIPLQLGRTFDLVVSLEVAEHLPPERAGLFVRTLVGLGPVVLFSAAIPLQGGTHHVNEQWPDYWAALFDGMGYVPVDAIRRRVWEDPHLEFWYAQNILIYVRRESLGNYPTLQEEFRRPGPAAPSMVHPNMHREMARRITEAGQERAAEIEQLRAQAEACRERAESLTAEVERRRKEANLANIGLRRLVLALPSAGWNTLKRRARTWSVRK